MDTEVVDCDLHIVTREELLELRLSGRISEIPDVETTSLGGGGKNTLVVNSGGVFDAGVLEVFGEVIDGSRHCG
jgi:hypothetical protein